MTLVNLPFPFPSFFFTIVPATVSPSRKKTTSSLGRWLKNARWRLPPKQVFPGRRHLQALLFWCCCWDGKARAEFSQVLRIIKASRKQVSPFYSYTEKISEFSLKELFLKGCAIELLGFR